VTQRGGVVITGASGGIGRETALELGRRGYPVCVHYFKDRDSAEQTVNVLKDECKVDAFAFGGDIADENTAKMLIDQAAERFGTIYALVCIAGISPKNNGNRIFTEDTDPDQWDLVMRVNLRGMFLPCKYVIPLMKRQREGNIITMSSIVGRTGWSGPAGTHYAASKGAIINLTRTMAKELGPYGIRVNGVAPGWITTPLTQSISSAQTGAILEEIPLRRFGRPEDVAKSIAFLLSSDAGYITGVTLDINGGWYIG